MRYFMNAHQQSSGDYEVHNENCSFGKLVKDKLELGNYLQCQPAVERAIALYCNEVQQKEGQINGCYYCCNPCNTG